jgi:hypothetical protein
LAAFYVLCKTITQPLQKKLKRKDFILFWGGLVLALFIKAPLTLCAIIGFIIGLSLFKIPAQSLQKLKPIHGLIWSGLTSIMIALIIKFLFAQNLLLFMGFTTFYIFLSGIFDHAQINLATDTLRALLFLSPALPLILLSLPWVIKARHDLIIRFCLAAFIPASILWMIFFPLQNIGLIIFYAPLILTTTAWIFCGLKDTSATWWKNSVLIIYAMTVLFFALAPIVFTILDHQLIFSTLIYASLLLGGSFAGIIFLQKEKNTLAIIPLCAPTLFYSLNLFLTMLQSNGRMHTQILIQKTVALLGVS